jgi:hypothetical protein
MIFLLPPGKNYTIVGNNPDGFPNNFSDHDTTDDCDASDADTAIDSIAINLIYQEYGGQTILVTNIFNRLRTKDKRHGTLNPNLRGGCNVKWFSDLSQIMTISCDKNHCTVATTNTDDIATNYLL